MLVRGDGSIAGTIGGGLLEATAIREAAVVVRRSSRLVAVELRGDSVDSAQMICGGRAEVLVAFVPPGTRPSPQCALP
jgi:xanthine dehydrogenase accessory factor